MTPGVFNLNYLIFYLAKNQKFLWTQCKTMLSQSQYDLHCWLDNLEVDYKLVLHINNLTGDRQLSKLFLRMPLRVSLMKFYLKPVLNSNHWSCTRHNIFCWGITKQIIMVFELCFFLFTKPNKYKYLHKK